MPFSFAVPWQSPRAQSHFDAVLQWSNEAQRTTYISSIVSSTYLPTLCGCVSLTFPPRWFGRYFGLVLGSVCLTQLMHRLAFTASRRSAPLFYTTQTLQLQKPWRPTTMYPSRNGVKMPPLKAAVVTPFTTLASLRTLWHCVSSFLFHSLMRAVLCPTPPQPCRPHHPININKRTQQ
jgi:hypothetical protein